MSTSFYNCILNHFIYLFVAATAVPDYTHHFITHQATTQFKQSTSFYLFVAIVLDHNIIHFTVTSNTIFVVYCTIRVYGRQVLQLLATSANTKIDNTVRIEIVCISTRLHSSVTPQAPALKLNCPALSHYSCDYIHFCIFLPKRKRQKPRQKKKQSKANKIRSNQIGHQLQTNCAKLELQLQLQ